MSPVKDDVEGVPEGIEPVGFIGDGGSDGIEGWGGTSARRD